MTLKLKGWKFSDGQVVNAQSVMFFLNMYKALPADFWGYNPGYGIPDQVSNITHTAMSVTINFKAVVNPLWITNNYLDQITPFPNSWDVTAGGAKSSCATGAVAARRLEDCGLQERLQLPEQPLEPDQLNLRRASCGRAVTRRSVEADVIRTTWAT